MSTARQMAQLAMGILACTVFTGPAIAQDNGGAHSFLTPTDIKWGDAPPTLPKGAKIAVLDQSKENAEKVAAEVKGVALVGDVTSEDDVKAAIAKGEAANGTAAAACGCGVRKKR